METAIVTFLSVFTMVLCGSLLVFQRGSMAKRVQEVINPRPAQRSLKEAMETSGFSVGGMMQRLEHVVPRSKQESSVTVKRLVQAGYRDESAVKVFYGSKAVTALLLCAVVLLTGLGKINAFFYLMALGIGYLGPDFWVGQMIKRRLTRLRKGLPDVLDLMIICIEAGLSLDQATARTAAELHIALPDLCDELGVVVLEQRAGRPRAEAWKNLAERTGEETIGAMVAMLVQAEQFGTSIARSMRVHSDTLRTKRIQEIEEKAAKLSIKLLFPLVLFIFPAMFVVVLGPAMITMSESFKTMFSH
ncbi:MAG TPA: type II secretion system F family protein [Terracidiphilus sp.]|nr:type II secretion system F family protein [Terracidiphilus sp.]